VRWRTDFPNASTQAVGQPTVHGTFPATQAHSEASMESDADWPSYGGTYDAQRFSSLTQINRDNVSLLARAWEYRTGDLPSERWGAETTPLKVGNTVYMCSVRHAIS
jgi:quinoprotein glucose dehydrogenase